MESLLSGLIGALIATFLSAVYLYLSEQSRLRSEVSLEVVGYFDDIYIRLKMLHIEKNSVYTGKKSGLTEEEYRIISRNLNDLLNTSKVGAWLEIVYNEGNLNCAFNELKMACLEVSRILWSSTEQNWGEKNNQILSLFKQRIDPLRTSLERNLIEGTRAHIIIKNFVKRLFERIFYMRITLNKEV